MGGSGGKEGWRERAIGKTREAHVWPPDAFSRIHFASKGPLSFHPLSAHIFGNQPSPPCSSVNRITLPERRINFVDGGTPAERKCKGIVRESNLNSLETRVEQGEYGSSRVNNAPFVRFKHVGRWVMSMVKVISQIVLLGGGCSRFNRRLRALRIYN